jgi:GNAT superfamily N-acetyltransferase
MTISLVSAADRPDLIDAAEAMSSALWPDWLDTQAQRLYWSSLYQPELLAFQTIALEDSSGAVVGLANSIPFLRPERLPDTGWSWVLEQGVEAARAGTRVDALSALSVAIRPDQRGTGLATRLLEAMKPPALRAGLKSMVAPVRPTLKGTYPLQDFATYIGWRRPDGTPFDPWLRTHEALGATIIGPAMNSMTVSASLDQWQRWTGLRFPASGRYAVPGMLAPLDVDLAADTGVYREPNLWMEHPLG